MITKTNNMITKTNNMITKTNNMITKYMMNITGPQVFIDFRCCLNVQGLTMICFEVI